MYENGRGVAQSYAKALALYRKAAEKGNAMALNNLGHLIGNGMGVRRDRIEGLKWFSLAAARGFEAAKIGRDQSRSILTPAQIAEAQRRAREWERKHPGL
jgi:TPR repeat protein